MLAFLDAVALESERAQRLHVGLNSSDEALAVLLEEVREVESEVFLKERLRNHKNLREELIQTASVCCRWAIEILGVTEAQQNACVCQQRSLDQANRPPLSHHEALTGLWRRLRPLIGRLLNPPLSPAEMGLYHVELADLAAWCWRWSEALLETPPARPLPASAGTDASDPPAPRRKNFAGVSDSHPLLSQV